MIRALASRAPSAKAGHMNKSPRILLLAGSFEARCVAEALSARGFVYDAWLSEAPRGAAPMPQVPHLRHFSDSAAFEAAVVQGGYGAVLDAGHVFDRTVTRHAFTAAGALGLPYLRLERPAWAVAGHPRWRRATDVAQANAMIPAGARVFCATGWDSLPAFEGFRGETLMLRQTRRHGRAAPFPFVKLVFGDPPFSVGDEKALFALLGVDLLICRNLGGVASRPKLDAAAALEMDVILIDRPEAPAGLPMVTDVNAAMAWVSNL